MHLSAGAHGRSRTVVHGAPRCQAAGMHQGAGAHRWWCTVVHGAIRCQAAGMHLGARCTQASVHLLRDSLITHTTTSVPKRPDAPRCTVHLGARRPGCTLVQVHKRPDAPRCTVQYGARRPGCTSVQVHGDPNAPHQGAGAARAPCVTLGVALWGRTFKVGLDRGSGARCFFSTSSRVVKSRGVREVVVEQKWGCFDALLLTLSS